MPALMAIISGNADPLRKELAAVQRMANQTGASLQNMGGAHGGRSGAITEFVVMARELSRGNFSRLPGSLTLFLQRMGVLNLLMRDGAHASQVLADAWEAQSAKASMAAVAATRKAQASLMAFEADAENTDATLAQAVADEEGAAAAIANAKATQAKAVAAREAAAAQGAGAAGGAGIGALGVGLAAVVVAVAAIWAGFKQISAIKSLFGGLEVKDFHPEYIAKHLQSINRIAEEQKQINKEVEKSITLYNSAAEAAKRVSEATKSHYDHLRKMASFEKDPRKRAQRELQIDEEERAAELRNKATEQANLEIESREKQKQAQAINVSSKEEDENNLLQKKEAAEAAQKFLDTAKATTVGNVLTAANPFSGVSGKDIGTAFKAQKAEARQRIAAYQNAVDQAAANEELRKKREALINQSGKSAAAAAVIAADMPRLQKNAAQANADEAEEMAAQLANEKGKMFKGNVNSLQQIGAYAAPAVHIDIARQQLHTLKSIDSKLDKIGGGRGGSAGFTQPQF